MIVDISKWQGAINWALLKAENAKKPVDQQITGVYIKATQGVGYIDPKFKADVEGAIGAGLKVGFYHFATLNDPNNIVADAAAEASAFLQATKGYKATLPYVLDIEENKLNIQPDHVLVWIKTFFGQLEHNGISDYVIYSYAPFLDKNLPAAHDLGHVKLWLAAYVPVPRIPKGWANYWMWQYSSQGSVPGITGHVDLNKLKS